MPERRAVVEAAPFLSALTSAQRDAVAAASNCIDFPAQVVLQSQHSIPDYLFIIVEGGVECWARDDDEASMVGTSGPGSVFTLPAVLTNTPTTTEVRLRERSRVLMVPVDLVRLLISQNHAFCKSTMLHVVESGRALLLNLHAQKMRNATERLALWLLENRTQDGFIEVPFELRTLAASIGTSPENLSRAFSGLQPTIVMKTGSKKYKIVDLEALVRIARPSPLVRSQ